MCQEQVVLAVPAWRLIWSLYKMIWHKFKSLSASSARCHVENVKRSQYSHKNL